MAGDLSEPKSRAIIERREGGNIADTMANTATDACFIITLRVYRNKDESPRDNFDLLDSF